jgi:hypothetical protein
MHFPQALLALAAALAATVYADTAIPNGGYTVTNVDAGVQLWTSFTDSTLEPITVTATEKRSAKFAKRRTDCWGNGLDRTGVDNTLVSLRGWANAGTTLTSGNGPQSFGYVFNGVYSYYCITRARTSGNLDIGDVNHAIGEMDKKCAAYTASWYGWDGSSEIVGKAATNQQVCTGPF